MSVKPLRKNHSMIESYYINRALINPGGFKMSDKSKVKSEVKRLIELGNSIYLDHPIPYNNIEFRFTLRGYTAGKAHYISDNSIRLWFHPQLMAQDLTEYIKQVCAHEVAHLYQRKIYPNSKPHGREFKDIAHVLGDNGSRCHTLDTTQVRQHRTVKRYVYYCPKCYKEYLLTIRKHNTMITYNQYNSGRYYVCKFHYETPLKFSGNIINY